LSPSVSSDLRVNCAYRSCGQPQPPHARGHALLAPERLRVAKAGLDCKARHGALADRVK
jgi:hypothetical protein